MYRLIRKLLILLSAAACVAMPATAQERRFTLMDRQLDFLMENWPGEYDNIEQLELLAVSYGGARKDNSADRTYARVARLDAPQLGDNVLLIEDYRSNDRTTAFRKRVYVLSSDETIKAIRVRQFRVPEGTKLGRDTKFQAIAGCDILINRNGDFYEGTLADKNCSDDPADYSMKLSANQYWTKAGMIAAGSWRHMEKARRFACMIDFPKTAGGRPTVTHHYIKIHDQGGEFSFVHPDGREMLLFMRNTWSDGMHRETFVIGVLEDGYSGKTLVYAWGNPGADRIGVNPVFLRVQCDLDTPQNVQMQKDLRPDS
ncbi:hypothetical protein [Parasphingorhabdus sp.]|uniref:hypothetical protein n=1 Tax=Parasphingorhabdus sp. TaxID=2709688 RepID=UPI003297E424